MSAILRDSIGGGQGLGGNRIFGRPPSPRVQPESSTGAMMADTQEAIASKDKDMSNSVLIAQNLCRSYPAISVDRSRFDGRPHIKNIRLSVGNILGHIYALGSIDAVVELFAPDISEQQVKDAIAFAQEFVEAACDQRPEIDGRL